MKLKDIKDVLTMAAFRPQPEDNSASWSKRFPGKKTLLVNVSRKQVSWKIWGGKHGKDDEGMIDGELEEAASQMADEWKGMSDEAWCGISLNSRFVISLQTNLFRKQNTEELIRNNPKAALGGKYERGKRYAVTHNPESNTSVLLACDEDMIKQAEKHINDAGFSIGRVACGTYAMLAELIDMVLDAAAQEREKSKDAVPNQAKVLMVACCEGSVCALLQQGERWTELRSRSDLYAGDDMSPVLEIIEPILERAVDGTQILYMCDQQNSSLPALLKERHPATLLTDVSVPNQLWSLLGNQ